jgi:hypothetical protein
MAKCDYCGTRIWMGGVRAGEKRFCNKKCYQDGMLIPASDQVPPDVIRQQIEQLHQGQCPKCNGPGPVDVHPSYLVYSMLIITRWSSQLQLSCRSCGVKEQLSKAGICLVAGWWGFPWGLIFTPIQIGRNLIGVFSPPDPAHPSWKLEKMIRVHIGNQILAQNQARVQQPPAVPASTPPPLRSPQEPPAPY